ncbi:resistance to inhibitors of cholinesterase protein 3 [Octopus bimaculoides]|nr:resistance to inhibitors of cholinesterase protein 3 [Octopus bimaculoides]
MSTIKVIGVFSIIFGCFAMLYPRFLHPIVLKTFGMTQKSLENDILSNVQSPKIAAMNQNRPRPGEDIRPIRPNAHPGLRAASEMRAQQQQAGSGRGMMGIVLPMYAVGIVLYLIYTLVKVSGCYQLILFLMLQTYISDFQHLRDCYNLTSMYKRENPGKKESTINSEDTIKAELEMRQLQQRLEETETQMTRILQAMQSVQQHVSGVVDRAAGNMKNPSTDEDLIHEKEVNKEEEKKGTTMKPESLKTNEKGGCKVSTSDSTPDLESYEVLRTNNRDSQGSSDYCWLNGSGSTPNSPEVETVSSVIDTFAKKDEESASPEPECSTNSEVQEKEKDSSHDIQENEENSHSKDSDYCKTDDQDLTVEDIGSEENCTDDVILRKRKGLPTLND